MASTYTTIQGDTWDLIAWKLWGEEKYMKWLIEANWREMETLVFPAGVVLNVPDLPAEATEDKPFWRSDDETTDNSGSYDLFVNDADIEETDEDLNDNESEDDDEPEEDEGDEDPEE